MACDALVAHWREDHNGPTANGSGLVSREAEQLRQLRRNGNDVLSAHRLQDHGDVAGRSPS
jgi:hypothetical protein